MNDPVNTEEIHLTPIGHFRGGVVQRYALPPQPGMAGSKDGVIELIPRKNFEVALEDLVGFSHIWVLAWFHDARGWKPKVQPPLRVGKRGVFATRSPHRPNPIGLSCLELAGIRGRNVHVRNADLIEGTPILDIKPYVATYDSHADATLGWVREEIATWRVEWAPLAATQREWLRLRGTELDALVESALTLSPYPRRGHRVEELGQDGKVTHACFACRTWRVHFDRDDVARAVTVTHIKSGHSVQALGEGERQDVTLHREYLQAFREDSSNP